MRSIPDPVPRADDQDMQPTVLPPTVLPPTGLPPAGPAREMHARESARSLIHLRGLTRVWGRGESAQKALADVDLDIAAGELVAVVGPSGSGKSTLGALIAGLDRPDAGSVVVCGSRLDRMPADDLAVWRSDNVGIVFQNFNLIATLTALENVLLALRFGRRTPKRSEAARAALAAVGLEAKAHRLPSQLSGGEQQRVGIARAMVHRPALVVADEPTGSLDTAAGRHVFELIQRLRNGGTTVVFITHDLALASLADRTVHMRDGRIDPANAGSR